MWFYTLLLSPIHSGVVRLIWDHIVGDGGTGKTTYVKVCDIVWLAFDHVLIFKLHSVTRLVNSKRSTSVCTVFLSMSILIAWSTFDSNRRCWSEHYGFLNQLWRLQVPYVGYSWTRKVRRFEGWLLRWSQNWIYLLRVGLANHLQKCSHLVSRSCSRLRRHRCYPYRNKGRYQGIMKSI